MQTFKDSVSGQIYQFEDDVVVTESAAGVYSFETAAGVVLSAIPTTLLPYIIPAPTAAELLAAAQATQTSMLSAACQSQIVAGFPYNAEGVAYTITLSIEDQRNDMNAAIAVSHIQGAAMPWAADAVIPDNGAVIDAGEYFIAMPGGTTGTTVPVFPTAFSTPVVDGTVTWYRFGLLIGTDTGTELFGIADIKGAYAAGVNFIHSARAKYKTLKAEVAAAATVADVEAIVW